MRALLTTLATIVLAMFFFESSQGAAVLHGPVITDQQISTCRQVISNLSLSTAPIRDVWTDLTFDAPESVRHSQSLHQLYLRSSHIKEMLWNHMKETANTLSPAYFQHNSIDDQNDNDAAIWAELHSLAAADRLKDIKRQRLDFERTVLTFLAEAGEEGLSNAKELQSWIGLFNDPLPTYQELKFIVYHDNERQGQFDPTLEKPMDILRDHVDRALMFLDGMSPRPEAGRGLYARNMRLLRLERAYLDLRALVHEELAQATRGQLSMSLADVLASRVPADEFKQRIAAAVMAMTPLYYLMEMDFE